MDIQKGTSIGQNIIYYRNKKRISQKELAESINMKPSYLLKIEKGVVNPTAKTIMKIIDALDITPNQLFGIGQQKHEIRMDNVKEIEKIYYNFDKLSDTFEELPETEETYERMNDFIEYNNIFENAEQTNSRKAALADLISEYRLANEKQGFIYGFQYAVSLLMVGTELLTCKLV